MHGQFVWYDVMTTDTKAAEAFYCDVFGWSAKDSSVPGKPYTIFSAGPEMVGGLMAPDATAAAMGVRPCWTGYVGVADVDAAVAGVLSAGGAIYRPAEDIPGVGRFAVVADPHGAVFIVFTPLGERDGPPVAQYTPGHVAWHELMAGDLDSAFAFYASQFGWTKGEAIDMGPMGIYQLFSTSKGGPAYGGMMTKPPHVPRPFWLFYVSVAAIDPVVARVTACGGQVINPPMQVPGGGWIAQCLDPQGAMFAMVGPAR